MPRHDGKGPHKCTCLQVRLELMDRRDFRLINAHHTQVTALALSINGARLATASEKGTLVRIFETTNGTKLQELRRGTDPADVYHLTFDRKNFWLAVTSDKQTVHVFALAEKDANGQGAAQGRAAGRPRFLGRGQPQSPGRDGDAGGPANPGSWFQKAQVRFHGYVTVDKAGRYDSCNIFGRYDSCNIFAGRYDSCNIFGRYDSCNIPVPCHLLALHLSPACESPVLQTAGHTSDGRTSLTISLACRG
jgi:WD40 repeat protein